MVSDDRNREGASPRVGVHFHGMTRRSALWGLACLVTLALTAHAAAQKPGKGGGGGNGGGGGGGGDGGEPIPGLIAFSSGSALLGMDADGGGVAPMMPSALPHIVAPSKGVYGDSPHDRLWLKIESVGVDPDGRLINELVAFRTVVENGALSQEMIQITDLNQALLATGIPACSNDGDDSFVSFAAVEPDWTIPAAVAQHIVRLRISGPEIDEGSVTVTDGLGTTHELDLPISFEDLSLFGLIEIAATAADTSGGTFYAHDWSPDGSRLVVPMSDASGDFSKDIWVVDAGGGNAGRIFDSTPGSEPRPRWSPDGSRIAFMSGGIWVVSPGGANASRILTSDSKTSYGAPSWSPDSSALAFGYTARQGPNRTYHVGRIAAGGGSVTVLAGDLDSTLSKGVYGWLP